MKPFTIYLANPRGFCAGVDRAIEIVNRALDLLGAPIYVRHEVVHNQFVVSELKNKGAIFVDDLKEIPPGSTVIYSAHGVSQQVRQEAAMRQLNVFDATCPLVSKVHMEVMRFSRLGHECILIGHAGHPEVEGTMGQYHNPQGGIYLVENLGDVEKLRVKNPEKLAYISQTTLSVDDTAEIITALRQRYPAIHGPRTEDICYATQNRQDAVKDLAKLSDLVLVVGSKNSSNSNRLQELAARLGCKAYLIDNAKNIDPKWFSDTIQTVGVTAGASAPEILVKEVIHYLESIGGVYSHELNGRQENIVFALPKELRHAAE
ncbi:MAG: 4-hydroxy-3-methylbut-2-enyl diphosphate reductase [Legionellales bacterium]|nr:4-hydroxy-3-methylbut-2-enyl diphosphate reductase [Legionellales bacterium]